MPPKKKVERAAQENVQLGPQVREGALPSLDPMAAAWKVQMLILDNEQAS